MADAGGKARLSNWSKRTVRLRWTQGGVVLSGISTRPKADPEPGYEPEKVAGQVVNMANYWAGDLSLDGLQFELGPTWRFRGYFPYFCVNSSE